MMTPKLEALSVMHNADDVYMEEIATRRSSFWIDLAGRRDFARREIFK